MDPSVQAFPAIRRGELATLQVNLGYRCNQSCVHCHVSAGPSRQEMMTAETVALIPAVLQARGLQTLDLTGGAPELHPQFRHLVRQACSLGVEVIDRCNLTILSEPGQEDLAGFLAAHGVTVVASLPCYAADNVDRQRGEGVFERSIAGLRQLNDLGYGHPGRGPSLHLVYNPQGPSLPPPQLELEEAYRRELAERFGLVFDRLFTITNMPIQRFAAVLHSQGQLDNYHLLLRRNHDPDHLAAVMCRALISVDWQGHLHDCDFNQMLGLPLGPDERAGSGAAPNPPRHLRDLLRQDPSGLPIAVGDHCFGCTAGGGSSCGGALDG